MPRRRHLLLSSAALGVWPAWAAAQQRRAATDPLRLGVDPALMQSGLARALQTAFAADTGVAVVLVEMPALPLLESLDRGEVDAALANAPDAEARLEQQGLVHDRRVVARGEFVLVGPPGKGRAGDPAGIAGAGGIADALTRIAAAAASAAGGLLFLSPGDGSGTHVAEQGLWREAKTAPVAPWYASASVGSSFVAQVSARRAYALVERGAWAAAGAGSATLLRGSPAPVHVMRGFRVNHPAAKIFVAWIAGPSGRRVVAAQRAYSLPA